MLSYVRIPAPETSNTNNPSTNGDSGSGSGTSQSQPQRNLSLNLSPQSYGGGGGSSGQRSALKKSSPSMAATAAHAHDADVDALLANIANDSACCDERTRLLSSRSASTPPRPRRQNSMNNNNNANGANTNNNSFIMNDNSGNVGVGSGSGGGGGVRGAAGDALSDSNNDESSDKQQQLPRQTTKKPAKLSKLGSKSVGLKRVSFGSSKGSMVETLVFETPTPLSEHMEPAFGFDTDGDYKATHTYPKANMDDSGIEVQEESERSIVRVSIYQSSQPQQICPPDYLARFEESLDNSFSNCNFNLDDIMTAASTIPGYDRQQSTDSGWDNPFRPGGDLSREADEIVNMIRGGKPITPTEDHSVINGSAQREEKINGTTAVENVTKSNITQTQSAQNGTNSHRAQQGGSGKSPENNGSTQAQVSKQVVPGPTSASHVVIDEKKNKKKGCCVIQ